MDFFDNTVHLSCFLIILYLTVFSYHKSPHFYAIINLNNMNLQQIKQYTTLSSHYFISESPSSHLRVMY